jgi:hypothetical protein
MLIMLNTEGVNPFMPAKGATSQVQRTYTLQNPDPFKLLSCGPFIQGVMCVMV